MIATMLIGPGQVAGRVADWLLAPRLGPLAWARVGALLFPTGALLLLVSGPAATFGFGGLDGMINGILTINRGTLPMLVLGPVGYARLLGWLAVLVLLGAGCSTNPGSAARQQDSAARGAALAGMIAAVASLLLLPLRITDQN